MAYTHDNVYNLLYKSNEIVGGFHLGKAYSLEDSKVE